MNPETHGPWGPRDLDTHPAPAPTPVAAKGTAPPRRVNWVWTGILVGVAGLIALLMNLFPGRVSTAGDWGYLGRAVTALLIVSAGISGLRHLKLSQTLRYVALWAVIIGVVVVGYTLRHDLSDLGQRILGAAVPDRAQSLGSGEVVVSEAEDGSYYVTAQVNGQTVTFLADTGASDIVLSPADAARLGVDLSQVAFKGVYETANGKGHGAPWRVDTLSVGAIGLTNVDVSINQAPMRTSLLGMAFFHRLKSFRFEGGRLILTAR